MYLCASVKGGGGARRRGFAKLLEADEAALEHVYVGTLELLDATWLQQRASYMEFPSVMAATKKVGERGG